MRGREKREVADVAAQVGDDAVHRAVPLEDSRRDHGLGTPPAAVVPQAGRNDAEVPAVHGLDAQRRGNPEAHVASLAIHADAPEAHSTADLARHREVGARQREQRGRANAAHLCSHC